MKTPVLFIGGEHDEVMPVSLMEVARGLIPTARMSVVAGAGHSVYFEEPDVFNQLVLDFFAELFRLSGSRNSAEGRDRQTTADAASRTPVAASSGFGHNCGQ